jgi:hypothetical protein
MSNQKLGILAAVAAVMVAWAVLQSRLSSPSRVEPSGPTYLIQGLDPAEIDSIVVGHGDKAITITRKGGRFVVVNEADYPADPKQINDLISKCLDIKTTQLYTSNPKNQADLEVTEEKARGVVKLFTSDGALLTGVIVGKSAESGQGSYVRMAASDDVYLTDSAPWFRNTPIEYVNAELTALKREDVNSVTVTAPDGTYTLRSENGGDGVVMADLPADKTLKASDAKSVLTALTSLRFDDVNAPAAVDGLNFDHQYTCLLNDSTEYVFKLAKKDGKTYLQCEANYTDTTPVTIKRGGNESEEELKKKEAKLLAQEHAQKFTVQHKNWVYRIPDWKANYLTKTRADLLEDKPEAVLDNAASVPPTPAPVPTTPAEPPVAEASEAASAAEPNNPTAVSPGAAPPAATQPQAVPEAEDTPDANAPETVQ